MMRIDRYPDSVVAAPAMRAALLCFLLTALVACSNPVGLSSSTLVPEQSVLAYYQWMQSANPDAVAAELRSVSGQGGRGGLQEIKRALLLSVPPDSGAAAEAEAVRLLAGVIDDAPSTAVPEDYRVFAAHWHDLLLLRRQLGESGSAQTSTQSSLDELRRTYDELEHRYEVMAAVMDSLEKQNGLLEQQNRLMQQQIDALTVIEQQLVERDTAVAIP